jgi:hypothetical protein
MDSQEKLAASLDRLSASLESFTDMLRDTLIELGRLGRESREPWALTTALRQHIAHGPTDRCLVGSPEFNARFDPRKHCSVCNPEVIS